MFTGFFKLWSMFRVTVRGVDTSKQLAMGVAIGMLVGFVPKDSLLCYVFGFLLLMSTANLLCGTLSVFASSWIALLLDPIFHKLGGIILTYQPLTTAWTRMSELPIVPWTRFNNTIVLGSLLAGLTLMIPVYLISKRIFEAVGPVCSEKIGKSRAYRWFAGIENKKNAEPIT